tara:strand:- start:1591 stop:3153 length:1563 start_codon:yes stop_codon:yes gene_type:complete
MFHKDLQKLFACYPKSYVKLSLTGESGSNGKKQAKYITVHENISSNVWKDHLDGKYRIGLRPELGDECCWACIDIDPNDYKNYSKKKYIDIISNFDLPFIPVVSKSGGLHLFIFFKKPAKIDKVKLKLQEFNEQYFLANEIFPCNKTINMPYFNMNATMEFAYNNNGTPVLVGQFIEIVKSKAIDPHKFYNLTIKDYEVERDWKHFPPCVQKLVQEGWSGGMRHQYLYNVTVLEMKKTPGINYSDLDVVMQNRNKNIFTNPLPESEVSQMCKTIHKEGYNYQCPPKHTEFAPICNYEVCKTRRLGRGEETPTIIDKFTNITYVQDTKNTWFEFDYESQHITVTPDDMKDEKSWRVKLLRYRVYWLTLPKPRKGPSPFEMLMKGIVEKSVESKDHRYVDTIEEERYEVLKKFFESHIEQDRYEKLKDGYVVLDSNTNICYFKKITLANFLIKSGTKSFTNPMAALRMLDCKKIDYHEGEKNVWSVEMPEFVKHKTVNKKTKDNVSEMDDDYHTGKFRAPKT